MRGLRVYLSKSLGILCMSLFLFSCQENNSETEVIQSSGSLELFSEIEMQQVQFDFKYELPVDMNVGFEAYGENPLELSEGQLVKKNITPVLTGITNQDGEYNISRYIGNNVDEIYILSENVGTPLLLFGKISNGVVKPEIVDLAAMFPVEYAQTKAGSAFSGMTLGSWNWLGKPNYISKIEKPSSALLKSMSSIFHEWCPVDEDSYKRADIYVEKDAQIWISLLHSGSLFDNVLGYFSYKGDIKSLNPDKINEIAAFPRAQIIPLLSSGLKRGEMIQLKYYNEETNKLEETFPSGTSIGWVLRTAGYSLLSNSIKNGLFTFYSYPEWNPESSNKNHSVLFKKGNQIIVGFEDMPNERINGFKGDKDCNDVVFTVTSSPASAISDNIPEIPDNDNDAENDEVSNSLFPLTYLIDTPDEDFYKELYVKSVSTLSRKVFNPQTQKYGGVYKVRDELTIANEDVIGNYIQDNSPVLYRAFVKTTIRKVATKAESKKVFVKTTIRRVDMDIEELRSAEIDIQKQVLNAINQLRSELDADRPIRIIIEMEFDPVPVEEFQEILPVGPYSLYITE